MCRNISTGAKIVVQLGVLSLYPDITAIIEKNVRSENINIRYNGINASRPGSQQIKVLSADAY